VKGLLNARAWTTVSLQTNGERQKTKQTKHNFKEFGHFFSIQKYNIFLNCAA